MPNLRLSPSICSANYHIGKEMSSIDTSQDTINAAVWGACDTFRGTVDPSVYKDYVLTMLFLKYISDVWQDH